MTTALCWCCLLARSGDARSLKNSILALHSRDFSVYSRRELMFAGDGTFLDHRIDIESFSLPRIAKNPSDQIRLMVKQGPKAIPGLVAELNDNTRLKITIGVAPFGAVEPNDRFDATNPTTAEAMASQNPRALVKHSLTVGDIAYYLLGQIVNRRFDSISALSGLKGEEFNGPSASPDLAFRASHEWRGISRQSLRASLIADVLRPRVVGRDVGGIRRLFAWYPGRYLENLVVQRLNAPVISGELAPVSGIPILEHPGSMVPEQYTAFLKAVGDFHSSKVDDLVSKQLAALGKQRNLDADQEQMAITMMARLASSKRHRFTVQCITFATTRMNYTKWKEDYVRALDFLRGRKT